MQEFTDLNDKVIMKKLLLSAAIIAALMSGACSRSQSPTDSDSITTEYAACPDSLSLMEGYEKLAKLPDMTERPLPNVRFGSNEIIVEKNVSAGNIAPDKLEEMGNAVYSILDAIPLKYMINGANNNLVGAFVYANKTGADKNEVLIVSYSKGACTASAAYGSANDSTIMALQHAPIAMEGQLLDLTIEKSPRQMNLVNFFNN